MDEQRAARGRRLARSTAIFALATGISRVLGLVREIVAAYYFGAAGKINAFTVAFQVPNLFRSLVADAALSSAFVPVFSELLEKGERKRAWRVASSLFWLMLLGLGGLTALLIVFAPLVIAPFGDPGGDVDLAVGLSRVLFPIVVLLGVSGVIVGILNSYDQFTVPALAPVFWNLAIIAGLVLGVPHAKSLDAKLYVYAISIVIGTVIQVLLPLPWLRGLDGRLQMVLDWRDPAIRRVFTLMVPVTIGLGLINFNLVVDSIFASRLIDPNLAPTAIDKAFRIYMLPQGMFSVAVATVLFPLLSRLATRGDLDGFRHMVGVGLRQIAFLLVPASVFSAVLAEPIVRLIYEHGEFNSQQTPVVAASLAAFAAGLTFNGTMLLLNRAFFSLQSPWLPTAVALGNLVLNAAPRLGLLRLRHLGHPPRDDRREHRGHGRAARVAAPSPRADRAEGERRSLRPDRARLRGARRSRVRILACPRRGARTLVGRADRLGRRRARGGHARLRVVLPCAGSSRAPGAALAAQATRHPVIRT